MLLDILVYGLIAIYVGLVILGHVFLLRALIRRTASEPTAASKRPAREVSGLMANVQNLSS